MRKAKRITIDVRAAEVADVDALTRLFTHRNAYAQTLQLPLQSTELWRKRLAEPSDNHHALVATVNGELVGNLGLTRFTRPRRAHVGEIGMAVRDDWQGKGVGSALMKAALELADNWLGLRRLELNVYADNERAIALYRKFGFEIEGTHRAYSIRNGAYVDSLSMARLIEGPRMPTDKRRKSDR
ncbi:GNAT family N-acetyltransferase [Dongia deserti]|uniref:GNAT family N-acetyltransferase n=1 Tax=Dongia deserti TaxID=2268030 RepID=UPI000E659C20|nr:GNAT family N-acetyltransferase [Dongia deserti]